MSFLRPEAVAAIRLYAEPIIYAVITAAFLWKGAALIGAGAWIAGILMLVPGLLAALAVLGAIERALVAHRSARAGPGIVTVEEGRITYLGPYGGAAMAVDALMRIDIVTDPESSFASDARWEMTDETGQRLSIPASAANAGALLDVLGGLPGFSNLTAIRALHGDQAGRRAIWHRHVAPLDEIRPPPGGHGFPQMPGSAETPPGRLPPRQ